MNKKKILNLLVASSTIAGGIGLSSSVVQATEVDNNANTDGLTQNTTKVDLQTSAKVINVNSNLNVRSDAGINYDTIGYVYNGQEVKILSEKGDWYRISFEGREGYVSKEYISIESENKNSEGSVESVVSESNKQGRAVNVNSTLNIRQSANTNSPVLGTLKNGDIFEIISKTGEWYNIKSNNIVGFISANYVQEVTGNETTIENVIQTITENYEIEKNEDSASTESGVVVNVLSNLRVRRGASASSDVMGYLLNGQAVSIKGETSGWYKIDFNGQDGYVSKEYIQKGSVQTSTASHITSGGTGKVVNVSSHLNIRSGAGTGYSIVGSLSNEETVNILEKSDSWYHISHNGITGYVSVEYLQEVSAESSSTESISSRTLESSSSGTGKVVNVSSHLNIRAGAGTGYSIVGSLSNGVTVNILGKSGSWYHISHNGITGYVSAEYLQEISSENISTGSGESSSSGTGKVVNISSHLNIRSGAGTGYSIVGSLSNGATVNILGKSGSWYHISHNGITGYVSAEYLQELSSENNSSISGESSSSGTGKVVNVSSHLNIRAGAGTGYSIVGSLSNGVTVNILGKSGSWYHISHNGITGYVSAEYLQEVSSGSNSSGSTSIGSTVSSGKGQVYNVTSNLRVRSNPSTNSTVLGYLLNGEVVDIIGSSNGWVHINYQGTTGYVSAEYIKNYDGTSSSANATAVFNEVYNVMRAHIGSPYVWGGSGEYLTTSSLNSLKSRFPSHNYSRAEQYVNQGYRAFDCSGLMQWGFRQVGIIIGRTTYDQINNGYEVSLSNLQPGDLLFYGDLSHVGMYIGNGQWIESPNSNANIRVTTVPWSKITRARRVIC